MKKIVIFFIFFYNYQKINVHCTIYLYSIHAGIKRLRNVRVRQICYQDLTPTHYLRGMKIPNYNLINDYNDDTGKS